MQAVYFHSKSLAESHIALSPVLEKYEFHIPLESESKFLSPQHFRMCRYQTIRYSILPKCDFGCRFRACFLKTRLIYECLVEDAL